MFDFIFKRTTNQAADQAVVAHPEQNAAAAASASRRDEQTQRAATLAGDEAAAVALILHSEFAGVRLAAAAHVQSPAALEQVLQAMRNSDRRVAKLMQGRLEAIRYQQAEYLKAQACLDMAQRLLDDAALTPNQVAELDRQWRITAAVAELSEPYAVARAALAARLAAQVTLQRNIIDALAALRQLPSAGLPLEQAQQALAAHSVAYADYQQASEHKALPKHLLSDFALALEQSRAALETASVRAVPAAASADAPVVAGAELVADVSAHLSTDASADASVQLPAPAPVVRAPKPAATPRPIDPKFLETLAALEAALSQGSLHVAAEHDKWLKEHKAKLTPALSERLNQVRAELKRLGDWARWGGNVSREELVKAVEELPTLGLAMGELANKVGSMRERWKALDAVSGHAPKSLWERFDSACSTAYAPAAAHFKQLADERHANAAKAQVLIDETRAMAISAAADGADLKLLAAAGQRLRQLWGKLGTIERKEQRKLDQAFDKALAQMLAPLSAQRKIEMAQREQLISEAGQIDASDRHALGQLRRLQERWQQQAKALPLERKAEQALWQRFRSACDAVFAQRKQSAHAAEHERKAQLQAREALCQRLETTVLTGDDKAQQAAIAQLLRDVASAWHGAGAVPRAAEARITQRYQTAVSALQGRADAITQRAGAAQVHALRDKLRLCQALESVLAVTGTGTGGAADVAAGSDWPARWAALPALAPDYDRALHGRYQAALAALAAADEERANYVAQFERNRVRLLDEVLRLEIVAGIDSGAEFARARLKMQVEVLQSSLKSGQKPHSATSAYLQLCALAAPADARTASRIEQLLRRSGAGGRG